MTDNAEPGYTTMTNGSYTLNELTSKEGPAGEDLFTPKKASTNTEEYEFTGIWVDYETKEEISVKQFADYQPERDMKQKPNITK